MLIGNLLAQAGMEHGLHVTFLPVYGAEMRGGTANCSIVLSADVIGSPIVKRPHATIIMNQPSLDKFQPRLHPSGVQIVNASLIEEQHLKPELRTVFIPMNDIANSLGQSKLANMVALGALIKVLDIMPLSAVEEALNRVISAHYTHLIPFNVTALQAGFHFGA